MADTATAPAIITTSSKKAAKMIKKSKPTHPKTSEMVNMAIQELKERNGSSLQAVKKYISANYQVDSPDKLAPFIKKYIKAALTSGGLEQTKGKGASGSFRLAPMKGEKPLVKKSPAKTKSALSVTKTTGKKLAITKRISIKSPANKKAIKAKSPAKLSVKAKSPVKKTSIAKLPKAKKAKSLTSLSFKAHKPKKMAPKKK